MEYTKVGTTRKLNRFVAGAAIAAALALGSVLGGSGSLAPNSAHAAPPADRDQVERVCVVEFPAAGDVGVQFDGNFDRAGDQPGHAALPQIQGFDQDQVIAFFNTEAGGHFLNDAPVNGEFTGGRYCLNDAPVNGEFTGGRYCLNDAPVNGEFTGGRYCLNDAPVNGEFTGGRYCLDDAPVNGEFTGGRYCLNDAPVNGEFTGGRYCLDDAPVNGEFTGGRYCLNDAWLDEITIEDDRGEDAGKSVNHNDILLHEDNGMMQVVQTTEFAEDANYVLKNDPKDSAPARSLKDVNDLFEVVPKN